MGAAVCALCIVNDINPIVATIAGMLGGMLAGLVSGFLHTKMKIPAPPHRYYYVDRTLLY